MEYILALDEVRIYVVIEESDEWYKGQQLERIHDKPNWESVRAFNKREKKWMLVTKEQADRVIDWMVIK